jgi:hypothetical protein
MIESGNGRQRHHVRLSAAVSRMIRRVHRRATSQGRGWLVTKALGQIVRRLELDPFHLGEPAYRLPDLRLQVRRVVVRPIAVDFAVSEDRPLVFIKGVKLLSM